jgi:hypothetical protein
MSGQFQAPAALPGYPLDRRLGRSQSRSGRFGKEENLALPAPLWSKKMSRVQEYINALAKQSERLEQGYIEGQKLLNFKGKRYIG